MKNQLQFIYKTLETKIHQTASDVLILKKNKRTYIKQIQYNIYMYIICKRNKESLFSNFILYFQILALV